LIKFIKETIYLLKFHLKMATEMIPQIVNAPTPWAYRRVSFVISKQIISTFSSSLKDLFILHLRADYDSKEKMKPIIAAAKKLGWQDFPHVD